MSQRCHCAEKKLSLQYAARFAANPSNPAFEATFQSQFPEFYENKPDAIKTFGIRIAPLLEASNINPKMIKKQSVTGIPSWCLKKPTVIFDLHNGNKSKSNPPVSETKFHELQSRYSDYQHIYTVGSIDEEKVGCAFTTNYFSKTLQLPDGASIFTTEIKAVELASELIKTNPDNKFIIFSNFLSGLKALIHSFSRNAQIQNLLQKHHEISKLKEIIFAGSKATLA